MADEPIVNFHNVVHRKVYEDTLDKFMEKFEHEDARLTNLDIHFIYDVLKKLIKTVI